MPELIPYDEFGLFHENAAEYGLPYPGPPDVRRVDVEVSPGRRVSSLVWGTDPPELVLVHGGAQNAHTWDTVALALGRPLVAVDLPGHGHSDGGPEGSISVGSNGRDLATVVAELAPAARGVVGMSLGGMSSLALAAQAPELVRALVLVDITPGVNAEKAAPVTNFVNGPASFDSFDDLLARTMEHNPTRSESSLRRGILHNAVQREDGSWVWRYARFRTEPASSPPDFTDWWEAVSALTVPLMLVRGLAWSVVDDAGRRRAAAPPAHGDRGGRRGGGAQRPGRPARSSWRASWPGSSSRTADGQAGLAVAPRPQAARGDPRRRAGLHGAVRLADHPCPRGQQPQLGLRLRVAHLRGLRRLHVVALRARGGRGHAVARPPPTATATPAETGAEAEVRPAQGRDEQGQDADLAAYNEYLAQLAERDKATGR